MRGALYRLSIPVVCIPFVAVLVLGWLIYVAFSAIISSSNPRRAASR